MFTLYTRKEFVPSDIRVIKDINTFYDAQSNDLDNNDAYVVKVLAEIENARITAPNAFVGKFVDAGVYRQFLSTGTKSCLLIHQYHNICFDLCECGSNVHSFLLNNAMEGVAFYDGHIAVMNISHDIIINNNLCHNRNQVLEALK